MFRQISDIYLHPKQASKCSSLRFQQDSLRFFLFFNKDNAQRRVYVTWNRCYV